MKITAYNLLAALGDLDVLRPTVGDAAKSAPMGRSDVVLLAGALLAVTLLLMLGIAIWIKARRHRRHHHHRRSHVAADTVEAVSGADEAEDMEVGSHHRHRRRRKRRRDHRQMNPTLAETGGLPPIREGPPPSL